MDWEIFTYGGGEYLRLTFNAITALVRADDFLGVLRIAMLVGLIVLLVQSAFKGSLINWPWFIAAVFVYLALIVPRVNVIVVDRLDPTATAVVSNVPIGIGVPASIISRLGDWLTRGYEATLSLPDEIQYHRHGLLFGNRLVDAASRFEITDPRTSSNMSAFWRQCVFYDLALGRYSMEQLYAAPDMWAFLQTNTSQVRAFPYREAGGDRRVEVCREGANGDLGNDLMSAFTTAQTYYARQLVRHTNPSEAVATFAGVMPVSFQWLTGLSVDASDVIRQSALSNSMRRGVMNWAGEVGASAAAQDYALARAEAERRTTYAVMGELASRMLPIIRNLFEAFLYAAFPIVAIMMMLPIAGKVLMGYGKALFWLALWAPLYAILHSAMSFYSRASAAPLAQLPDGTAVYSLATYTGLSNAMYDHALMAGYMAMSIPLIAWMFVNASGAALAALGTRIAASYEAPASRGAEEASTGNISLENTQFGNSSMWQQNTAPSLNQGYSTSTGADGIQTMTTADGGRFYDVPQSSTPISVDLQGSLTERLNAQESSMISSAQAQAVQASEATQAAYSSMNAFSERLSNDEGFARSFDQNSVTQFQQAVDEKQRLTEEHAQKNGLSIEQSAQLLGAASATVGTPLGGLVGSSISGSADVRGTSGAADKEMFEAAQKFVRDSGYSEAASRAEEAGTRLAASYSNSVSDSQVDELRSSLTESAEARQTASATFQQVEQFQQARETAESSGAISGMARTDAFVSYLSNMMGSESAALRSIQAANAGDDVQARFVRDAAQTFADEQATKIIGMEGGPNGSGIQSRAQAAQESVAAGGVSMTASQEAAGSAAVDQAAGRMPLSSRDDIRDNATRVIQGVEEQRAQTGGQIDRARVELDQQAESRQQNVESRLDNPQLLVEAGKGVTRVLPSGDDARRAATEVREMLGFRRDDSEDSGRGRGGR